MAKALGGVGALTSPSARVHSLRSVWLLRLSLGLATLFGAMVFLLGTSWDIQWHSLIGRDRTLIPPHIMMLGGVTLCGVAALGAILIETIWARSNSSVAKNSTAFADAFHGSLGAYITGFAALNAAIAFPLDSYWHSLYGIDVAIWAPFHVMFAAGMAIVALGAAYMLMSAAQLSASEGATVPTRIAYIGTIFALATMMGIFTLLLFDAMGHRGMIDLGFMIVNVFPLLSLLLVSWTFIAAVVAIPWRWVATSIVGVYILSALVMQLFVPTATGWLMAIEHLGFRQTPDNPGISLVTFEWPLMPILVALGVDIVIRIAHRRGWTFRRIVITLLPIFLLGAIPSIAFGPLYGFTLAERIGIVGTIVSLILGLLAAWLGSWLGKRMGEAMQQVERA